MDLRPVIDSIVNSNHLVILTGAGISAESGLPTFRGKEGYWKKNSKNYHPMELATFKAFQNIPETVWEWYHYRRGVYRQAEPNFGHKAIVELEHWCFKQKKNFNLVTQNVDGLHLRAGSNPDQTFQIHGNLNYLRCSEACEGILKIQNEATDIPKCPKCNGMARPHVLWFDEVYNEEHFKFQSALRLALTMDCLIFIGTTLQTNLPYQLVGSALHRKIPIIEINPELIEGLAEIGVIQLGYKSGEILPTLINLLKNLDIK